MTENLTIKKPTTENKPKPFSMDLFERPGFHERSITIRHDDVPIELKLNELVRRTRNGDGK